MTQFGFADLDFAERAISPFIELGAYEALWEDAGASFKRIAARFASVPGALPSDFVDPRISAENANIVHSRLKDVGVHDYGVRVNGAGEYPSRLRDADHPIELLYYQGWWELANSPRSIAIVGTRNPSDEGIRRTRRLVRSLLEDDFTIVSGQAKGVDATAHRTTLDEGGRTIAVLGTPLSQSYPKENADLQAEIASKHLLISQVPVKRYESAINPVANRHFFPARNVTMSALTDATVIVEAGESSGTLVQARAAIKQRRKLFILESCFQNPELTWPRKFAEHGAIRVREYNDIRSHLIPRTVH
ncbi:MAG: DNA-protecting protein DprA [Boseongicola sp.]|nr:DNA-protecting protein DprA [Boseongicola sp.]